MTTQDTYTFVMMECGHTATVPADQSVEKDTRVDCPMCEVPRMVTSVQPVVVVIETPPEVVPSA
jgi:DNA-directed RNA polymerase subunit RPC12/RpoP